MPLKINEKTQKLFGAAPPGAGRPPGSPLFVTGGIVVQGFDKVAQVAADALNGRHPFVQVAQGVRAPEHGGPQLCLLVVDVSEEK
jgi:hypothetical protein